MHGPDDYSVQVFQSPRDDTYIATTPEFPGLSAIGGSPEDALREMRTVLELAIEVTLEDGEPLPEPLRAEPSRPYSGKVLLRLPVYLHASLAEHARRERTSVNGLLVALISAGLGMLSAGTSRMTESVASAAVEADTPGSASSAATYVPGARGDD